MQLPGTPAATIPLLDEARHSPISRDPMKQQSVTTARKKLPAFVLVVEDDAVLGLTIENALLDAGV